MLKTLLDAVLPNINNVQIGELVHDKYQKYPKWVWDIQENILPILLIVGVAVLIIGLTIFFIKRNKDNKNNKKDKDGEV